MTGSVVMGVVMLAFCAWIAGGKATGSAVVGFADLGLGAGTGVVFGAGVGSGGGG